MILDDFSIYMDDKIQYLVLSLLECPIFQYYLHGYQLGSEIFNIFFAPKLQSPKPDPLIDIALSHIFLLP